MPSHKFHPSEYAKFDQTHTWIETSLVHQSSAQLSCLATNEASHLDAIDVAPNEGKLLYLLTKLAKAKRVLEIGTLGGYSALWFAKAVAPLGGKVVSLELSPKHAEVARKNFEKAGFGEVVEIRVGKAVETLEKMGKEGEGEFDVVFIDADKENNVRYLEWAVKLGKVGTLVVVDNVVRQGKVLADGDAASEGVRRAFEWMGGNKRLEATAIQTVGPKGWDGFAVAVVVEGCLGSDEWAKKGKKLEAFEDSMKYFKAWQMVKDIV
ncbi:family 3 O-methyltransferase [Mollisia scopiformis]|uniref:Family 3 O-methyltransferase n=1 Tax=Mollisia scopiformis TaxID=149040 RepID=A0A194XT95_MOLSC|nr:family 3 O-methyltransferase [Mollisia scopiformis]KUJ23423.1 family 3 O-methyltransferase [Mollisia scopiformis]